MQALTVCQKRTVCDNAAASGHEAPDVSAYLKRFLWYQSQLAAVGCVRAAVYLLPESRRRYPHVIHIPLQ